MILDSVRWRIYAFSPPMATSHLSTELLEQIETLSDQIVSDCYQCGCCTSGCPIGEAMDPPPSKAIRLLQLGKADELLDSDGIWLCASCLVCGTRCPRGVDYARIAEACRVLVLRSKLSKVDPDTVTPLELDEIPQQAFIAAFRKSAV
jgi:heterodisulfide reductase subunit C